MSGSSLDGLDIAYCSFNFATSWSFKLIHFDTAPLGAWEDKLRLAVSLNEEQLQELSIEFASFIADKVQHFRKEYKIASLDVVVSHGHTIYHYPAKGKTCQIGDGQTLARLLDVKVITNLRQADMDEGGQGAPIVPIGDLHLFKDFLVCLNLGGIANLSIKTRQGIFAFDVCAANQVLNHYAHKLGLEYDDNGEFARKGKVDQLLLEELNNLDFYKKLGPKSLDNSYSKTIVLKMNTMEPNTENALATYVEHIAFQIRKDLVFYAKKYLISFDENTQMLVTGGGAFNGFLIERIQAQLSLKVVVPNANIVAFKEAIVMAFIGVLKLRNEVNVLASVTGASKDTSCGEIFEKA